MNNNNWNEDFELESRKIENNISEQEIFMIDEPTAEEFIISTLYEMETVDLPF